MSTIEFKIIMGIQYPVSGIILRKSIIVPNNK